MVQWAPALQISMIGGAFIFAYIASTIKFNSKFDNGIRLLFVLFSLAMVLASTGMNYSILEFEDKTLTNSTNVGQALTGVFIGQLWIVIGVFIILFIFSFIAIIMSLKEKRRKQQYGESD